MGRPGTEASTGAVRFMWCLKSYAWIVLLAVFGLAAAPALYTAVQAKTYETQALVVSRQLGVGVSAKTLPALGTAVFSSGQVASQVAADPSVGGDPALLIPSHLDLVAAQDSVVFTVVGRDTDPSRAARLADLGARAFVVELNRGGPGVGVFAVQTEARVPSDPVAGLGVSLPLLVGLGALLGAMLSLGIVALIASVRRPVIEAGDVMSAVGAPTLGTVVLPSGKSAEFAGPNGILGIGPVTRLVASAPPGVAVFVSDRRTTSARQRILVMLGVALSRHRLITVQGSSALADAVRELSKLDGGERPAPPVGKSPTALILADGASPLDTIADPRVALSVVIVVRRGIPRSHLRQAVSDYPSDELFGAILVDVQHPRRKDSKAVAVDQPAVPTAGNRLPAPPRATRQSTQG